MFDAKAFIKDKFGTASKMVDFVEAYGVDDLTVEAAAHWIARNRIPGNWLALLLALLEVENGGPVSLTPYVSLQRRHMA